MDTTDTDANQPQESFLDDVFDTREYDKKVKQAQNTIFVVGAIQLVMGLYVAFSGNAELQNVQIGVAVFISALFFGLGFWCKSKPFTAIIIALALYATLLLSDVVLEPESIIKGLLVKIAIIVYLAKGIGAAKAAKDIKNVVGK